MKKKQKRVRRVVLDSGHLITWAGAYAILLTPDDPLYSTGSVWKLDPRFSGKKVRLVAEVLW